MTAVTLEGLSLASMTFISAQAKKAVAHEGASKVHLIKAAVPFHPASVVKAAVLEDKTVLKAHGAAISVHTSHASPVFLAREKIEVSLIAHRALF
jgi:hypothetical protein